MKLDYETVYRAVKGDHDAQEKLLQADGIEVVNGRVDLEKYQWKFK